MGGAECAGGVIGGSANLKRLKHRSVLNRDSQRQLVYCDSGFSRCFPDFHHYPERGGFVCSQFNLFVRMRSSKVLESRGERFDRHDLSVEGDLSILPQYQ